MSEPNILEHVMLWDGEKAVSITDGTREQLLEHIEHDAQVQNYHAQKREGWEEGFLTALRVLAAQSGKITNAEGHSL